jgi:hypothetical protein
MLAAPTLGIAAHRIVAAFVSLRLKLFEDLHDRQTLTTRCLGVRFQHRFESLYMPAEPGPWLLASLVLECR